MRISVVGTSGAGKSTLGQHISDRLGIPFIELDADQLATPAGVISTATFREEFKRRVAEAHRRR